MLSINTTLMMTIVSVLLYTMRKFKNMVRFILCARGKKIVNGFHHVESFEMDRVVLGGSFPLVTVVHQLGDDLRGKGGNEPVEMVVVSPVHAHVHARCSVVVDGQGVRT